MLTPELKHSLVPLLEERVIIRLGHNLTASFQDALLDGQLVQSIETNLCFFDNAVDRWLYGDNCSE